MRSVNQRSTETTVLPLFNAQARSSVLGVMLSLGLSVPAAADDIDIFLEGANPHKQNVLFVLDYSQSMNQLVPGDNITKREAQIEAVTQVIKDLGEHINVGVSFFGTTSSGIRWPISDTDAKANTLDADIQAKFEVDELVSALLPEVESQNGSNTVAALVEAALYYEGGEVLNGGHPDTDPSKFEPPVWDPDLERYVGGNPFAPNPAAYEPKDAFKPGGTSSGGTGGSGEYVTTKEGGPRTSENCAAAQGPSSNPANGPETSTVDCNLPNGSSITGTATGSETSATAWVNTPTAPPVVDDPVWEGANYIPPTQQECVSNYIVLVSDGDPKIVPEYNALKPHVDEEVSDFASRCAAQPGQPEGLCGPEIASFLNNKKLGSYEKSNVTTYTVGFGELGSSGNYLQEIARAGGGDYFEAKHARGLSRSIADIIDQVLLGNHSFAPPAVSVNPRTFANDNRVFYPMFTPSFTRSWHGNLKGYFLEDGLLKGLNGYNVIGEKQLGEKYIGAGANSFWTDRPDGDNVTQGGAEGRLKTRQKARKLFTFTGDTLPILGVPLNNGNIRNKLSADNTSITTDMLGIANDDEYAEELLDWIADVPMGAPLHSNAVKVEYNGRTVVYVMTNRGFFHAIDATRPVRMNGDRSGGEELFAFMPQALLKNIDKMYTGIARGEHIYGLDGHMVPVHDDKNGDGIVNGADRLTMVLGMRRGGSNYYAIDVTNPTNPVYKWKIEGGSGYFGDLAQTWSKPTLITIESGGKGKRVLAFGGGYDERLDTDKNAKRTSGNVIYMVDLNGNPVLSSRTYGMNTSIASDLRVVDTDNDGYTDRIYAVDVGGKVWRYDIGDLKAQGQFNVSLFADLSSRSYEPFMYPPSVSFVDDQGKRFLSIVVASGDRTDPLNKNSRGSIYMLRDEGYRRGVPAKYTKTIKKNDLYDATQNLVSSSNRVLANGARAKLNRAKGWFITLSAGEKVLAETNVLEGRLLATTFAPNETLNTDRCGATTTEGKFYALNLLDGSPVSALDGSNRSADQLSIADRSTIVSTRGIPAKPIAAINLDENKLEVLVGKDNVVDIPLDIELVSWYPRY